MSDQAYAQPSKNIGIVLSETCLTMLNNGIESTCPTYEDLLQLDSSKPEWSGSFHINENGVLVRGDAPIRNSWKLYDYDNTIRVFIDPPKGHAEKLRLITIHPNFDNYTMESTEFVDAKIDMVQKEIFDTYQNRTITVSTKDIITPAHRIIYHDRYVNPQCTQSTINADKWTLLVADTINYMRNACLDNHTSFNHIEKIPVSYTIHDITTTQKYKHDTWVQYVKDFCIFKFKECS